MENLARDEIRLLPQLMFEAAMCGMFRLSPTRLAEWGSGGYEGSGDNLIFLFLYL